MFDLIGGVRRLRGQAARRLPRVQRRRRPNLAALTAPFVAVAGAAAVAGLVLLDERRRTAMRRRMEEVAGSVTASVHTGLNRVAPPVASETKRD